jgi:hypothetical protein
MREANVNTVPPLPESAQLTEEQKAEAADVGLWLDEYVEWASRAANETPLYFHEGAGGWLGALAIGRQLYIHTPWRQRVFPNLYVMLVAVSTYYRKSAGLNLAHDMARAAMPHLILPQPSSPEAFMSMLGGVLPPPILMTLVSRIGNVFCGGMTMRPSAVFYGMNCPRCLSRCGEIICRV